MYSLSYLYQAIVFLVSQFNNKVCITEIFVKKCHFLPLNKQNTANTNEGTHFWITYKASYLFLYSCYIVIVILQHTVFEKLNIQPRHKTSSIIAKGKP